ncbi:uncharacterized protein LOC141587875 [Silene latifolia]|uniref:uncharacterized protein LOC141587875 n=1 Tax=Silene latifolia TaxID=37657 RepID=UPI003D77F71D
MNKHFKLCKINSGYNNKDLLVALQSLGYLRDQGCLFTVRNAENLRYRGRIFRTSDSYRYHIIGSCNGLLLVQKIRLIDWHIELRLCNPCIRKSLILPPCPLDNNSPYGLEFRYLLGFAPDSHDYKVVVFAFDRTLGEENGKIFFAVYFLSNQQWIVRNDPLNLNNVSILNCYDRRGLLHSLSTTVFFRGAAYWLGQNDKERSGLSTHLGSFDFDKENITF